MSELLSNPFQGICTLAAGVIVACTLIVFVTDYLQKKQQSAIDAYLKAEMVSRGMSAADIKTILEASSGGEAARLALGRDEGVHVGLGKFHVKLGEFRDSASEMSEAAAAKC